MDNITDEAEALRPHIVNYLHGDTLDERIQRLNALRRLIGELSPFHNEPVDVVEWCPTTTIHANDYNPNNVAPPEMKLLELSITNDGYTQPIVTVTENNTREVVDGFHRNRVGRESNTIRERIHGYLPVVTIRSDRTDKADRIAATVRHNRARGKHQVIGMSDIVIDLKRRNWTDEKISRELGMDPDEVLRLAQIAGLAQAFQDHTFSEAWEADTDNDHDDDNLEHIDN